MLQIRRPRLASAAALNGDVAAPGSFEADYSLDESERELGRGTHSVVSVCTHRASGECRAAKIIDMRRFRLAQNFRASTLLDEVRILRSIDHPNIIRVFEAYIATQPTDVPTPGASSVAASAAAAAFAASSAHSPTARTDSIVIVTELAPGGELFESIITAGNFSEPQACHVVWQVLRALELLHERDIVHRDVKPENLLVFGTDFVSARDSVVRPGRAYPQSAAAAAATDPDAEAEAGNASGDATAAASAPHFLPMLRVKLADFGVARYVGSAVHAAGASTFVGSPQYMAPEVLALMAGGARTGGARRSYGCAVDVYSLGVVLYVMLAGYLPFSDSAALSADARQHLRRLQEEVGGGEPLTWEDRVRHGAYFFSPPVWTHISEAAKAVIRGMMAADPAARLTVQQAMAMPWFDAVRVAESDTSLTMMAEGSNRVLNAHSRASDDEALASKEGQQSSLFADERAAFAATAFDLNQRLVAAETAATNAGAAATARLEAAESAATARLVASEEAATSAGAAATARFEAAETAAIARLEASVAAATNAETVATARFEYSAVAATAAIKRLTEGAAASKAERASLGQRLVASETAATIACTAATARLEAAESAATARLFASETAATNAGTAATARLKASESAATARLVAYEAAATSAGMAATARFEAAATAATARLVASEEAATNADTAATARFVEAELAATATIKMLTARNSSRPHFPPSEPDPASVRSAAHTGREGAATALEHSDVREAQPPLPPLAATRLRGLGVRLAPLGLGASATAPIVTSLDVPARWGTL